MGPVSTPTNSSNETDNSLPSYVRAADDAVNRLAQVSCWQLRSAREPEVLTIGKGLISMCNAKVCSGFARTLMFFDRVADRSIAAFEKHGEDSPLLVIEFPMFRHKGKHWHSYIGCIAEKTIYLGLFDKVDRTEAHRRASIWISSCPLKDQLGDPTLVDPHGFPVF